MTFGFLKLRNSGETLVRHPWASFPAHRKVAAHISTSKRRRAQQHTSLRDTLLTDDSITPLKLEGNLDLFLHVLK
jgi:hypothetical protein